MSARPQELAKIFRVGSGAGQSEIFDWIYNVPRAAVEALREKHGSG